MADDKVNTFAIWTRTIATGHPQFGLLSFALFQYKAMGPSVVSLRQAGEQLDVAKSTLKDRIWAVNPDGLATERNIGILNKMKAGGSIPAKSQSTLVVTLKTLIKAMESHLPSVVTQALKQVAEERPPPHISIARGKNIVVPKVKGNRVLPTPAAPLGAMSHIAMQSLVASPTTTTGGKKGGVQSRPSSSGISKPAGNGGPAAGPALTHFLPPPRGANRESMLRMSHLAGPGSPAASSRGNTLSAARGSPVTTAPKRTPFKVVGIAPGKSIKCIPC